MNAFKLLNITVLGMALLTGCAAGSATSATAGYSLMAHEAQNLSSDAEQKVVDRIRSEINMMVEKKVDEKLKKETSE